MLNEEAITYGERTNINYYGRPIRVVRSATTWEASTVRLITNNPNDCIPLSELITLKLKPVER